MEGGLIRTVSAPLPTEVPKPPDLSRLPSHILHSGTVETLIGHSEDVSARLMVNIRRNSVLETQVIEQERLNQELLHVNSSLTAQLEVFQEKDRLWRDKNSQVDDRRERLSEQVEFLEAKITQLETVNAGLRPAVRFQRRVRRWVAPLLQRLAAQLKTERENRLKVEAQVSDLKSQLSDALQELRATTNKFSRDQTKLVEDYESRLAGIHALREKAMRFDELTAKKTELENKVVYLDRRRADTEKQMLEYRQEAKTSVAENMELKRELAAKSTELKTIADQYSRLQDQFESVQAVWVESQKRIEASKLQHETLNRLNQELARQLKEQRRATERAPERLTERPSEKSAQP